MATFDMVPCSIDPASTEKGCKSTQPAYNDQSGTKLQRLTRFNSSNHYGGTKEECEAYGIGYTALNRYGGIQCLYPCPASYEQDPTDPDKCVARPLLTMLDKYYTVLQDTSKSCFEKSSAYKQAIMESGKDPSTVPFPAECPNPYSCSEGVYADKNDLPPMPDNTDTTVPSNSDPNGTSGVAGSNNNMSAYAQLLCKNGQWEPFIPPPPYNPTIDSSGGVGEPASRLTLTVEEIDKIPLESEYGSAGRKSTLAQQLYDHPTLLDVDPAFIKDYMVYVPDFVWSCEITQENFDKMPEGIQCGLVKRYYQWTTNPARVKEMRGYDPTILITRDAPSTTAPTFVNDLETKRRQQCEAQSNNGVGGCKWVGDCEGTCNCPPPPPPDNLPDAPAPPESFSPVWIIGGAVGLGVALYLGYQVYKVATPTGRAMSGISDGASMFSGGGGAGGGGGYIVLGRA